MKLTAQIKLVPTPEQAKCLKETLERGNAACNAISEYAWKNQVFNQFKLHKALYYDLRAEFELASQLIVRCLGKVADSYKLDKKVKRHFKAHGSIPYDDRILNYRQQTETVSIWVLGGRIEMPYQCGERQREMLKHQKGETDLWYTAGVFYLLATCEVDEPTPDEVDTFLGVDGGIVNLATVVDGIVLLDLLRRAEKPLLSPLAFCYLAACGEVALGGGGHRLVRSLFPFRRRVFIRRVLGAVNAARRVGGAIFTGVGIGCRLDLLTIEVDPIILAVADIGVHWLLLLIF